MWDQKPKKSSDTSSGGSANPFTGAGIGGLNFGPFGRGIGRTRDIPDMLKTMGVAYLVGCGTVHLEEQAEAGRYDICHEERIGGNEKTQAGTEKATND
jgi:hypothetical protein